MSVTKPGMVRGFSIMDDQRGYLLPHPMDSETMHGKNIKEKHRYQIGRSDNPAENLEELQKLLQWR